MAAVLRAHRGRLALAVAATALVAGAVLVVVLVAGRGEGPAPFEHRFVVPAGTAGRVDAGEVVEVLPARLELRSGDSVTIVNEDDVAQGTGFLMAPPHDSVTYEFNRPGTYTAACTLHPSGSMVVVVTDD